MELSHTIRYAVEAMVYLAQQKEDHRGTVRVASV